MDWATAAGYRTVLLMTTRRGRITATRNAYGLFDMNR